MLTCSLPKFSTWFPILTFLAGTAFSTVSTAADNTATAGELTDLEIIKERFIENMTASIPSDERIETLINSLQEKGGWPGIDYDDVSRTGFAHGGHLRNMRDLSRAFNHPDSAFYQDPEARDAVLSALDFWIRHDFIAENWWWNEMGTPDFLVDSLLLMEAELTETQRSEGSRIVSRASLDGFGARPGGDLIKIAGTIGKRALLENDVELFRKAVSTMADEVRIGTGRGLQPDLSLHHRTDRVTSTLTYGYGYASSFAGYAAKLKGTRFAFPEEALELLIDFYLDGIHKSMAHGRYREPSQLNRGITRGNPHRPTRATVPETLAAVSGYRKEELEELVAVRRGDKQPAFTFNKFFWSSEYLSHQRPEYFASVRMYSSRNHSVEQPYNEEGLRNHHLADGSSFILRTGREYADIFPVYDWRKIPGTTVVQKPDFPSPSEIAQAGLTDFVGGVSDGTYGAAAFDFESPLDSLKARKAWFFFDDEYVCLGAGIESDDDHPVATTLNQAVLRDQTTVHAGGETFQPDRGEHSLSDTAWIWHDGIAYIFPAATEARLRQGAARGNRRDINRQSWVRDEEVERDVFALWLDHGKSPRGAGYEYIVVPGIQAGEVAEYRAGSSVSIVANTPALQAVSHQVLGLSQIIFYEAGEVEAAPGLRVAVDRPGMVMIHSSEGRIERITVADPARKHDSLHLRISAELTGSGEEWTSRWDANQKHSDLRVDLPGGKYAGKSVTIDPR